MIETRLSDWLKVEDTCRNWHKQISAALEALQMKKQQVHSRSSLGQQRKCADTIDTVLVPAGLAISDGKGKCAKNYNK